MAKKRPPHIINMKKTLSPINELKGEILMELKLKALKRH
jgi:hypothetical protein